ncbi:MAG: methyltransferase domain-containing protein [Salinarimonas sp.]|nr:methyltransferase domain-containing protein [Salinarimonas sp.]
MNSPLVFDRPLVRRRLARAHAQGYADFLLQHALEDMELRLTPVVRDFSLALDVESPDASVARHLRQSGRAKTVLRVAPAGIARGDGVIGDAEALPFAHERFDLAVSLLGLHAVNDLPGALIQIRRALKPDGMFIGCLLGGATLHELRSALTEAESELTGGLSPRVAPFADIRDLGGLMQRAGFALPVTDLETLRVRYDNAFALMQDLRRMGMTNTLLARRREPVTRSLMLRAAQLYTERYADPDGRIPATFELIWVSGWSPHESQQKPLRPGSAKVRLADALGTVEHSAGEKAGPGG